MKAKLTFDNVEFMQNDAWTVRVQVGQPAFTMALIDAGVDPLQWTTTKDQVLEVVEEDATTAKITALKKGTSKVILLDTNDQPVFRLIFEVYDELEAGKFDVPTPVSEPIQ